MIIEGSSIQQEDTSQTFNPTISVCMYKVHQCSIFSEVEVDLEKLYGGSLSVRLCLHLFLHLHWACTCTRGRHNGRQCPAGKVLCIRNHRYNYNPCCNSVQAYIVKGNEFHKKIDPPTLLMLRIPVLTATTRGQSCSRGPRGAHALSATMLATRRSCVLSTN